MGGYKSWLKSSSNQVNCWLTVYWFADIIIGSIGFKFGEIAYFGGVGRWKGTVCYNASTTLIRVIGELDSRECSVDIGDVKNKEKYILGLIPCLLYQVEYDWKERAWAGRRKVKDTWLKGWKAGRCSYRDGRTVGVS